MEMPPGFADKMHVDDATSELSSSSISSPPVSPQNNALFDTIRVSRPSYSHPGLSGGGVVIANAASATSAKQTIAANNAAHATNGNVSTSASTTNANGSAPDKPKRQRKKKEVRILIHVTCLHI